MDQSKAGLNKTKYARLLKKSLSLDIDRQFNEAYPMRSLNFFTVEFTV